MNVRKHSVIAALALALVVALVVALAVSSIGIAATASAADNTMSKQQTLPKATTHNKAMKHGAMRPEKKAASTPKKHKTPALTQSTPKSSQSK